MEKRLPGRPGQEERKCRNQDKNVTLSAGPFSPRPRELSSVAGSCNGQSPPLCSFRQKSDRLVRKGTVSILGPGIFPKKDIETLFHMI